MFVQVRSCVLCVTSTPKPNNLAYVVRKKNQRIVGCVKANVLNVADSLVYEQFLGPSCYGALTKWFYKKNPLDYNASDTVLSSAW